MYTNILIIKCIHYKMWQECINFEMNSIWILGRHVWSSGEFCRCCKRKKARDCVQYWVSEWFSAAAAIKNGTLNLLGLYPESLGLWKVWIRPVQTAWKNCHNKQNQWNFRTVICVVSVTLVRNYEKPSLCVFMFSPGKISHWTRESVFSSTPWVKRFFLFAVYMHYSLAMAPLQTLTWII